ncbi:hypothetical protein ACFWN1_09805, partial [Streptomyces sp. NPDC058459]
AALCAAQGAVSWRADLDVDCDGQRTTHRTEDRDPWYQDDTAYPQSDGRPLRDDALICGKLCCRDGKRRLTPTVGRRAR